MQTAIELLDEISHCACLFGKHFGASVVAQNTDAIDAHLLVAKNTAGPTAPRDTWFAEPAKVFDNPYFVGSKVHSS